MVIQARLKIRHHGCISERLAGDSRIIHMSGDGRHCLSVFKASNEQELALLLEGATGFLEPDGLIDRSSTWAVARCHCPREGSRILPVIHAQGGTVIWPVIEAEGHEYFTVLAASRKGIQAIAEALIEQGDVTIEQMSDVSGPALDVAVSLSDVTQNLTRRQLDVLKLAVTSGYYDSPRRSYAEDLAAVMGMSRSTYQEHLQKAESAVMRTFMNLVVDHPALEEQAVKGRGRPRSDNNGARSGRVVHSTKR